jgi:NADP-dependent aldehyde dehydrogenase
LTDYGIRAIDPRSGNPVGELLPATSESEVRTLVDAAVQAEGPWASATAQHRAEALRNIADAIDGAASAVVSLADRETALGEERLTSELARTTNQLRMFAAEIESGEYLGASITLAAPERGIPDLRRMNIARGSIGVFAASNFPLAFSVIGGDTASALAAGCPVVVKAHENHPGTSQLVLALAEAHLPHGTLGLCHGREAGLNLVDDPRIKAVGFTGSFQGGRALAARCASRPVPIPFFGELGSINPVVILPDAARTRANTIADGFTNSLLMGNGQFCTKPGLMFVPESSDIHAEVARIIARSESGTLLTPRIRDAYRTASREHAAPLSAHGRASAEALAVRPEIRTITAAEFCANAAAYTHEQFGPAAILVTYESDQSLIAALRLLPGALTATLHSDHSEPIEQTVTAALRARVGRLILNGWPTGVAVGLAQQHGGPFPASTDETTTSVGASALMRWVRPVAYQGWPDNLLPLELRAANPLNVPRRTEGLLATDST